MRISISKEEIDEKRKGIVRNYMRQARLPGFRKGKVPQALIEKHFKNEIEGEVLEAAVQTSCYSAIQESGLRVLSTQKPGNIALEEDGSCRCSVEFIVFPDFELPEYKGVTIHVPQNIEDVDDNEVNNLIHPILEKHAYFEPAKDDLVDWGLHAIIDYKGSIDGVPLSEIAPELDEVDCAQEDYLIYMDSEQGEEEDDDDDESEPIQDLLESDEALSQEEEGGDGELTSALSNRALQSSDDDWDDNDDDDLGDDSETDQDQSDCYELLPSFIDSLLQSIIGTKVGESTAFEYTFSSRHYCEAMRGKTAQFTVNIKQVKKEVVPELTDEIASEIFHANSAEDVKKAARERVISDRRQFVDELKTTQVKKYLAENTKLELPGPLFEHKVRVSVQNLVRSMKDDGYSAAELEKEKERIISLATYRAYTNLAAGFVFIKIAEKEGIEVAEKELDLVIEAIAKVRGESFNKVKRTLTKNNAIAFIEEDILFNKVTQHILSSANLVETDNSHKNEEAPDSEEQPSELLGTDKIT